MDAYTQGLQAYNDAGGDSWNGYGIGNATSGGAGRGSSPVAPNRDDFLIGDTPARWQSNIKLSPEQQALYDSQVKQDQQISNIASGYMDRIGGVMGTPFSLSGLPGRVNSVNPERVGNNQALQYGLNFNGSPKLPGVDDFGAERQRVEDALYSRAASRLDPEFTKQQNQMDAKLANQGIMPGSEAYKNAVDDFSRGRNDAYSNAVNDAILAGGNEQSRLFGLGLSARQQDVGEKTTQGQFYNQAVGQNFGQNLNAANQNFNQSLQAADFANRARQQALGETLTERQLPLNEFNALRSASQIQTPQFGNTPQTQLQPTNVMGAYQNQYQGQMNNYNTQVGQQNSMMNGLFGLGGAALAAPAGTFSWLSDRRLKKEIRKIGKTPAGINIYEFKYIGDDKLQTGVMAQEVERVIPEAVITMPNGFKMVDYGAIH